MENHDLVEYKVDYYIQRFDKDDEAIKIDKQEFDGLAELLSRPDIRFVQLRDERIVNVNSIKEVIKVAEKPNTEIYAEVGGNPYYREWCLTDKKTSFREWLQNNIKKETL